MLHRGTFGHMGVTLAIRSSQRGIDAAAANRPGVQSAPSGADDPPMGTETKPDHVVEHGAEYNAAREPIEGLSGQLAGVRWHRPMAGGMASSHHPS